MTNRILSVAALFALSLTFVSCNPEKLDKKETKAPTLTIKTNPVEPGAGSQFATVDAEDSWSISLDFGGSDAWAEITPTKGEGSASVKLSHVGNATDSERSVTITIKGSSSLSSNVVFIQKTSSTGNNSGGSNASSDDYRAAVALSKYLELPATTDRDDLTYFFHKMETSSGKQRNFSYYWDPNHLVALWVAYPQTGDYSKKVVDRTNQWGTKEPLMTDDEQPILARAYSNGNAGWRARGHQIPSADRVFSEAANVSTFMGTNMTPQNNDFNGNLWASAEGKVRSWASSSDTLYVVTGCVPGNSTTYCLDNRGKKVTIPEAYFKALLRYKKGSTTGYSGYMGCALYFKHPSTDSEAAEMNKKTVKDFAMSIDALEEILGYDLFVNLPDAVGEDVAKLIEAQDAATNSWWW